MGGGQKLRIDRVESQVEDASIQRMILLLSGVDVRRQCHLKRITIVPSTKLSANEPWRWSSVHSESYIWRNWTIPLRWSLEDRRILDQINVNTSISTLRPTGQRQRIVFEEMRQFECRAKFTMEIIGDFRIELRCGLSAEKNRIVRR